MTASEFWAARGAAIHGTGPAQRAAHLEDAAAEARAAAGGQATCLVPLLAVTPLRITGSDRAAFLHGQLSNAVQGLAAGACNHTLQLNTRGQVVGEGLLCVREDDVFLAVDEGLGPDVRASLEAHIVFDDVRIEDLSDTLTALTVQGPDATRIVARAFGEAPEAGRSVQPSFGGSEGSGGGSAPRVLLCRRRRSLAGGVDVHLLAHQLAPAVAALEAAGAEAAGEDALELMRVLAGVPSAAREGAGGGLPQELGLAAAVSFGKGCYLGQEIMARIEARGAVRKGLRRLRLTPADPSVAPPDLGGRSLRAGGREVGRLGTAVSLPEGGLAALAVVRLDLPEAAALAVADDAGASVATAEPWPLPAEAGAPQRGADAAPGDVPAPGGVQPEGPAGTEL